MILCQLAYFLLEPFQRRFGSLLLPVHRLRVLSFPYIASHKQPLSEDWDDRPPELHEGQTFSTKTLDGLSSFTNQYANKNLVSTATILMDVPECC
mmetsp:Transcript_26832/g.37826  ORF Transcript_26832/g.37826 Transcript_26832/m.37826 type:complete len:95 (+) Transcript_26832:333-617(+)